MLKSNLKTNKQLIVNMEKVLLGIIIIIVSSCNTTKNINNEQSSTIGNHDYLKVTLV